MPQVTPGGKPYKHNPHPFQAHDANTICDVTGFRVKFSDVVRRWEGYYVVPAAFHPRQPQDFPVVPVKQRVYPHSRKGDSADEEVFTGAFTPGYSLGFDII